MEQLNTLWLSTGLYQLSVGQFVMILVGLVLLFRSLWIRHSGLVFQLVTFKVRWFASSLRSAA
jgi:Na+-transporting methylmalonyl-CoA/oxaloacetate decarboxylase beta subunit